MDIGSEKVFIYDPVLLVMDSLPSFDLIGKRKASKARKAGMMKFMTAKG